MILLSYIYYIADNGEVLDGPMLNSTSLSGLVMNQEPTLFVEAQPTQQPSQQPTQPAPAPKQTAASKARASKAKSQVKGSRVNKKPRTKSQSSSTPSSKMTASPEPSASSTPPLPSSMEHANQEASSNFETAVVPPLNSSSISQTPQYSSEASTWSPVYREAYQPPTHQFPAFSSRIEDVGGASEGGSFQVQGQTVRSQYIMATEDTVWRAE